MMEDEVTLEARRARADMVEVFKIGKGCREDFYMEEGLTFN